MRRANLGRLVATSTVAGLATASFGVVPASAQSRRPTVNPQVKVLKVRHTINRNVELVIGTTSAGKGRVRLGKVTVQLASGIGHAGAHCTFRLYIGGKRVKNVPHTCTYGECARQWNINGTYKQGTKIMGDMVAPGGHSVGKPSLKL